MRDPAHGLTQAFTLGSTYLLGSDVVNSFRFTADRVAAGKFPPRKEIAAAGLTSTALGIRAYNYDPTALRTTVTGGFNVGNQGGTTRTAMFAINVLMQDHNWPGTMSLDPDTGSLHVANDVLFHPHRYIVRVCR